MSFEPIAIVGQGCVLPGALTPAALWDLVHEGRTALGAVTNTYLRLSPHADRAKLEREIASTTGGLVSGFAFDPAGFALPEERLQGLDPVAAWTLHAAREALRSAGLDPMRPSPNGAVVLGNLSYPTPALGDYALDIWSGRPPRIDARNRFMSGLPAQLTASALGFGAGGFGLDAACASSLYAIKLACDRLQDRAIDLALAGGVNHADFLFLQLGFTALSALSATGQSRPFHPEADGLVAAEGAAIVVLERLSDAVRSGRTILGVIRGIGLSNDGRSRGLLVPSEAGQVRAMRAAYGASGIAPRDVSFVECHATGTSVGDATELASLRSVFEGAGDVPLGSLKANLGHLITASGTAALIKVLAAMKARVRPASPNAGAHAEGEHGPLRILTAREGWPADGPRIAAISNFGFGGNNAHLLVSEYAPTRTVMGAVPAPVGDLAIVALAVNAGSADTEGFADALREGRAVDPKASDFELDVAGLRLPPADLQAALPQQMLLVRTALELADPIAKLPRERTALLVGMQCDAEVARCCLPWRADLDAAPLSPATVLGCMPNIIANRLNQLLDLQGPSHVVSAEEASGPIALEIAARSLRAGEIDAAIVGAVDLACEPVQRAAGLATLPANRQTPGDAAVVLVVKRLADARRDGDRVLAILGPATREGTAKLTLDDEDAGLTKLFGHAHAASGLVHVAAAVVACDERALHGQPWLPQHGERSIDVDVRALGGATTRTSLHTDPTSLPQNERGIRLAVFGGRDKDELASALQARRQGDGDYRVAIVAEDDLALEARIEEAVKRMREAHSWPPRAGVVGGGAPYQEGTYFGHGAPLGELAFVFTGPAGAYAQMGRDLSLGLPELVDGLGARMKTLRDAAGWIFEQPASYSAEPVEKLWGSSYLIQLHAELTRGLLQMKPQASIGYCSGETNALFALDAWDDLDGFRQAIDDAKVYTHELCGESRRVRAVWNLAANEPVDWVAVRLRAPIDDVRRAIEPEARVSLTIINSANDAIIGGERAGCERVAERLGKHRATPTRYDFVMHCAEARGYRAEWRALHHRPTRPVPGVRFYTNARTSSYAPTADAVADALTGQAMNPVDFPALVRKAWDDGVRVFVEHGPHAGCTKWIDEALGDRPHLAVALDRYGRSSLLQAVESVARLVAAGVPMNHRALATRLAPASAPPKTKAREHRMTFPAHWPPVDLTPKAQLTAVTSTSTDAYVMTPPPRLPPVGRRKGGHVGVGSAAAGPTHRAQLDATSGPVTQQAPLTAMPSALDPVTPQAQLTASSVASGPVTLQAQLADLHTSFLRQQTEAQAQFMRLLLGGAASAPAVVHTPLAPPGGVGAPERAALPVPLAPPIGVGAPAPAVVHVAPASARKELPVSEIVGPSFSRADLEVLAAGVISSVFGELFQQQDGHARQVRMPEPPLLLADRVLGIKGEPGSMGTGTVWTQTDIPRDAWYLHEGRMPAGILVESGQADLLLISWLGIDFLNRGERVYRLLGCDLTSHGELPRPGDTLTYDIHVDGHAQQGDVRLFFFHYDCRINGELRVSVRNGQAGFFTAKELADSAGILWKPETAKPTPEPRLDAGSARCEKRAFSAAEISSFIAGDTFACFGPGFERAETHSFTPAMQGGRMRLLDEVTHFDPAGGPWKRGYLRARLAITPESWFFAGHFKNDPCMPGTLMFEGCLQAMSIYLAALGYTLDRDGFRFEPVQDIAYQLRCRGQALPTSKEVLYEVFVDEIVSGPDPTLYADLLGTVDGLPAFHCRRMGLRLIPAWPMDEGRFAQPFPKETRPVARVNDFEFGYRSLLACAWGRPSEAFGPMYERFDGNRRVARLPGPPYHFMSRITDVKGPIGGMEVGSAVDVEYDVPPDAWYFGDNGAPVMPYAVLLEVALQACGWLSSYVGSALTSETDLVFRNLDGKGAIRGEVRPDTGTLVTRSKLKSLSTAGGLIILGFDVTVHAGTTLIYEFDTVFGFFGAETMRHQVGLKTTDEDRARLTAASDVAVDLRARPTRYFDSTLRLAAGRLLMIDRITAYLPNGGKAGLGQVRAEKDITAGEWFFKAHFFQDPVQPGSLGLEALLQALQFAMIESGQAEGMTSPRFEAIAVDKPMTWKYRGQVVPENRHVVADVEITETGTDERGRFAIANGSLWVDGKRIYEAIGLAMRIVDDAPSRSPKPRGGFDRERTKEFWRGVAGTPAGWGGEDVLFALLDRFVGEVHVPRAPLTRDGRGAIFLANHQVAVETILAAIVIGGLTHTVTTLPAKAEHRDTWIGALMRHLTSRPGTHDPALMRFVDREDPESFLALRKDLLAELRGGRSVLVHAEGTRATASEHRVKSVSGIFLDLAIEADVDIVPVRFVGGLPANGEARLEFPVGFGRQDYWFGEPITASALAALPLAERKHRVLSAINALGVDTPSTPAPDFAARVAGAPPETVLLAALLELVDPSAEGGALRAGEGDDAWTTRFAAWLHNRG